MFAHKEWIATTRLRYRWNSSWETDNPRDVFALSVTTETSKALRMLVKGSAKDLFRIMAQVHLPIQKLSEQVTNKVVEVLHKLLSW